MVALARLALTRQLESRRHGGITQGGVAGGVPPQKERP